MRGIFDALAVRKFLPKLSHASRLTVTNGLFGCIANMDCVFRLHNSTGPADTEETAQLSKSDRSV